MVSETEVPTSLNQYSSQSGAVWTSSQIQRKAKLTGLKQASKHKLQSLSGTTWVLYKTEEEKEGKSCWNTGHWEAGAGEQVDVEVRWASQVVDKDRDNTADRQLPRRSRVRPDCPWRVCVSMCMLCMSCQYCIVCLCTNYDGCRGAKERTGEEGGWWRGEREETGEGRWWRTERTMRKARDRGRGRKWRLHTPKTCFSHLPQQPLVIFICGVSGVKFSS